MNPTERPSKIFWDHPSQKFKKRWQNNKRLPQPTRREKVPLQKSEKLIFFTLHPSTKRLVCYPGTNSSQLQKWHPKRKGSSSNHQFQGRTVSFREDMFASFFLGGGSWQAFTFRILPCLCPKFLEVGSVNWFCRPKVLRVWSFFFWGGSTWKGPSKTWHGNQHLPNNSIPTSGEP